MVSYSKYKLFVNIINMVIGGHAHENSNLSKCEIRWCGDRYDLIFYIKKEYYNPLLLYSAIIETCNEMFTWIDISNEVSIVIVVPMNTKHFTYFELIDKTLFGDRHNSHSSQRLIEKLIPRDKEERFFKWRDYKINKDREKEHRKISDDIKKNPHKWFGYNKIKKYINEF